MEKDYTRKELPLNMKQLSQISELAGSDLIEMEGLLCRQLAAFFSFNGHALYFPVRNEPGSPLLLPRERRLLLPLVWKGRLLGVFMAHGVRVRELRALLSVLPAVTGLCLENLAGFKAARTDSVTGLLTEETFFTRMEDDAARVRACLDNPEPDEQQAPLYRLCMGIVLLRLCNGGEITRHTGYAFSDEFVRKLADSCVAGLLPDVFAARVGCNEFALLLPIAGNNACHDAAKAALARMDKVCLSDPLTQRPVRPLLCAGYALYPQDMRGADDFVLPVFEQVRRLMALAGLAADAAWQSVQAGGNRVMSFARILQDGGVILEEMPLSRLRVSLGRRVGAYEGSRFAVWGSVSGHEDGRVKDRARRVFSKGEIVLVHSRETDSVAEILHVADAASMPEPGDSLTLLDQRYSVNSAARVSGENSTDLTLGDVVPDICGHGEFLQCYSHEREQCFRFVLAIMRVEMDKFTPKKLVRVARMWRDAMASRSMPLAGRYGSNSLIVYHPGLTAEELLPVYARLCNDLKKQKLSVAVGLAPYPFLRYSRDEMRNCSLKALEYALLLPEPRVGICNSLALNISADRLYSLGDMFGAVEEYKLALLADRNNAMAWNSLGVCMAALGQRHEARRSFLQALRRSGDNNSTGQACYNLGTISESLGQRRAAFRYYHRCIAALSNHYFAHIRLGRMCEQRGRRVEARRFYVMAAAIEDTRPEGRSIARRHLAGLAARQRRSGEARELLHEALLRNPEDAAAMLLLAGLYLDGDEDPAIAEMLARKSASIHDRPEAWRTLARALRALNRDDDAHLAEARAGDVRSGAQACANSL
jgi:tetratricopeptide (TPR) repeat protein